MKRSKERRHPAQGVTATAIEVMPKLGIAAALDFEERQFLRAYIIFGDLRKALEEVSKDLEWYEGKKESYPDFAIAVERLGQAGRRDGETMMSVMVPWTVGELRGLIEQGDNLGVKMAAIKYLHEAVGVGSQYRQGMPGQGNYLQVNVKVATGEKETKVIELGKGA